MSFTSAILSATTRLSASSRGPPNEHEKADPHRTRLRPRDPGRRSGSTRHDHELIAEWTTGCGRSLTTAVESPTGYGCRRL